MIVRAGKQNRRKNRLEDLRIFGNWSFIRRREDEDLKRVDSSKQEASLFNADLQLFPPEIQFQII